MEPACILPTSLDMDLRSMFAFVRRQFMIGRYYSPVLWTVALAWNCVLHAFVLGKPGGRGLGLRRRGVGLAAGGRGDGCSTASSSARAWLRQRASQFYLPDLQAHLTARARLRHLAGTAGRPGLLRRD